MKISPFKLLCGAGLFAIFSSTISKNPVLPLFASYLGAGPSGVGAVAAVSSFTGILASIPAGILSDRFGRKKMLMAAAVVFATAPFLYLAVTEIWQLAIVRFYHGLATAIFVPVAMAAVADLFHAERGEKLGWFSTSTLAGRFVAPLAGGAIIGAAVLSPAFGYRAVFLVCGASGIIALALTALLFRLRIPYTGAGREGKTNLGQDLQAFKALFSNRLIITTAALEGAVLFAYGTFETFLPLYALAGGISAYWIGVFLAAQIITLAFTKPFMGRFSDRHGRRPQIIIGGLAGAVSVGILPLFSSFFPLLAVSVLFGLSLSVVTSATSAFIADSSSRSSRGSAMGILGSVMDVGHTAGPLVSGVVAAYAGLEKSFIGASLILFLVALLFLAIVGTKRDRGEKPLPAG